MQVTLWGTLSPSLRLGLVIHIGSVCTKQERDACPVKVPCCDVVTAWTCSWCFLDGLAPSGRLYNFAGDTGWDRFSVL